MQNGKWTKKPMYRLLKHPCQADKPIIEDTMLAYLEFAEALFDCLNKGNDRLVFRQLNAGYIDLGTLKAGEESYPAETAN